MRITPRLRLQILVQNGAFVALLIVLATLLAYVAQTHRFERDLTQSTRNTLAPQTREVLGKFQGPLHITIYAMSGDPRGDQAKQIRDFLAPYIHIKPDIDISVIDPRQEPKLAQAAGITLPGQSVIEYNQRSEHISDYTEQGLLNTFSRLLRGGDRLIMSLQGDGERSLNGIANFDLGEFGKQLAARGFKINTLNLGIAQEVPANLNVLIIANPQVDLNAAQVQKIQRYLQQGGDVLWLVDNEPLHGLQPIADQLGVALTPGVVWDPSAVQLRGQPTMAIASAYGEHAVTHNFQINTAFPFARRILTKENSGWHATRLVEVAQRGWLETGKLDNHFDQPNDIAGPINIALALERDINNRSQRIVVVGSGNFLANAYLGNAGNLDLGVNMINWLAGDDALVSLQPRPALDTNLQLTRSAQYVILFGFLIILPAAFISAGFAIWWRRRKG